MNFLNLDDWTVHAIHEDQHDYRVEATCDQEPVACVHCGEADRLYRHGRRKQVVMDLPSHGKRVGIEVDRARFRCRECGKTFLQPLTDVHDTFAMTERLVSWIEEQSLQRPFTHIASEIGVDEKTIRNIFNRYVERLDRFIRFETPRLMGIDELHLMGKPRLILTDLEAGAIVALEPERTRKALEHHFHQMEDRDRVEVVSMDTWKPYRDAVRKWFPKADVVVDKYHVVRLATDVLEGVRRKLRDSMNTTMRRKLMRSRWVLLKREHQLTDKERATRDGWHEDLPALHDAYWLKEWFCQIYDHDSRAEAEASYQAWKALIPDDQGKLWLPVVRAVDNWHEEVFAYFDHGCTNAMTEALNGIVKIANRTGRGYSFKALRAKMLYAERVERPRYGQPVVHMRKPTKKLVVHCPTPDDVAAVLKAIGGMGHSSRRSTHKSKDQDGE